MRRKNPEHRIAAEEALMEKMSAKSVANFKSVFDKIENKNANNTKPSPPRGSTLKSISRSVRQMLLGKNAGGKKSRKPVIRLTRFPPLRSRNLSSESSKSSCLRRRCASRFLRKRGGKDRTRKKK